MAFLNATAVARPRLFGTVHAYRQKHLPQNIHPAYNELRGEGEAAAVLR